MQRRLPLLTPCPKTTHAADAHGPRTPSLLLHIPVAHQGASDTGGDEAEPGYDVMGVPLATVHEGKEAAKRPGQVGLVGRGQAGVGQDGRRGCCAAARRQQQAGRQLARGGLCA